MYMVCTSYGYGMDMYVETAGDMVKLNEIMVAATRPPTIIKITSKATRNNIKGTTPFKKHKNMRSGTGLRAAGGWRGKKQYGAVICMGRSTWDWSAQCALGGSYGVCETTQHPASVQTLQMHVLEPCLNF